MDTYEIRNKYESIHYDVSPHLKLFVNQLSYRAPHFHKSIEIIVVTDNECKIIINKDTYNLKKGDCIIFNSNCIHEIIAPQHSTVLCVQVSKKYLQEFGIKEIIFDNVYLKPQFEERRYKEFLALICKLFEMYFSTDLPSAFDRLGIINLLFAFLLRTVPYEAHDKIDSQTKLKNNRMNSIINYIDEHFTEKITLEDVGKFAYITPQYLSHFFKTNLGISFREYLSKIRFNQALKLIDSTDNPLIDICFESGFSDYKYMEKEFIKNLGCSPKKYRMKKANADNAKVYTYERICSKSEIVRIVSEFRQCIDL